MIEKRGVGNRAAKEPKSELPAADARAVQDTRIGDVWVNYLW